MHNKLKHESNHTNHAADFQDVRFENRPKLEAAIKDTPEVLVLWREAMLGEASRDKRSENETTDNNVTSEYKVTGNSESYTLSRIEQESPEQSKQVVAGELVRGRSCYQIGVSPQNPPGSSR